MGRRSSAPPGGQWGVLPAGGGPGRKLTSGVDTEGMLAM